MNDDTLILIAAFVGVFYLGWKMGSQWAVYKIAKAIITKTLVAEELLKEVKEAEGKFRMSESDEKPDYVPDDAEEMTVVKEGDVYYLYRKSNNQFLGQGPTLKGAMDVVKDRFPGENFWGGIDKELADKWGTTKEIDSQKS